MAQIELDPLLYPFGVMFPPSLRYGGQSPQMNADDAQIRRYMSAIGSKSAYLPLDLRSSAGTYASQSLKSPWSHFTPKMSV